jgi:galactose mutarotase-like enzyme
LPAKSQLTLRSRGVELAIDPARGASIQSIRTPGSPRDWVFYDPSRVQGPLTGGERYDDVWCGGFEELFPTDAPGRFEGRDLPDHGELWNAPFEIVSAGDESVSMRRHCRTVEAVFDKRVSLDPEGAGFCIDYRIENRGHDPLHFLFKLHPALAIEPGDRILLPGGVVQAVDPEFGAQIGDASGVWPRVAGRGGEIVDLSTIPSFDQPGREFVYVSGLPAGWCGLEHHATGERMYLRFPQDVFPYCWLFLTYGGWRGYYAAVLEPCTNMPKDLAQAKAAGQCAVLMPGAALSGTVNIEFEGPHA